MLLLLHRSHRNTYLDRRCFDIPPGGVQYLVLLNLPDSVKIYSAR